MATTETLPEYCWSVLTATNELVMLKRGESGYFTQHPENSPWDAENCDTLNERLGVTKTQVSAMKYGSMFGFDNTEAP